MAQQHIAALIVSTDGSFVARRDLIAALAGHHAIPMMSSLPIARAGGLISYDSEVSSLHRQAGLYVGRILKGEKPADLPVQFPTKFHLAINLRTAKAMGLVLPESLLARADEVIE
jgi:putative ABC transport system substrate-binding protein